MLKQLISDVRYHLTELYEELKFRFSLPEAPYPLVDDDEPGLVNKIQMLEQQHALAKEARKISRHR